MFKQPNPNNYNSEEEYEKAQSQYEDYADEKYEREKEFCKGGYIENAEKYVGTIDASQYIKEEHLEQMFRKK